jgi:hypothetical protein
MDGLLQLCKIYHAKLRILTISSGYCWFFKYNLSSRSRVSLNSSVFVIVIILEAKLNGMFILICFGWLDLKLRYIWIIPFVTTYNPRDYNIFHFMKQIEFNLNSSERMKNVLQKKKIINSKRQPKNLNSHSSSQFSFGFTYIEFSTIRANNCVYKILSFAWYILHNCKSPSILRCKREDISKYSHCIKLIQRVVF